MIAVLSDAEQAGCTGRRDDVQFIFAHRGRGASEPEH